MEQEGAETAEFGERFVCGACGFSTRDAAVAGADSFDSGECPVCAAPLERHAVVSGEQWEQILAWQRKRPKLVFPPGDGGG